MHNNKKNHKKANMRKILHTQEKSCNTFTHKVRTTFPMKKRNLSARAQWLYLNTSHHKNSTKYRSKRSFLQEKYFKGHPNEKFRAYLTSSFTTATILKTSQWPLWSHSTKWTSEYLFLSTRHASLSTSTDTMKFPWTFSTTTSIMGQPIKEIKIWSSKSRSSTKKSPAFKIFQRSCVTREMKPPTTKSWRINSLKKRKRTEPLKYLHAQRSIPA